MKVYIIMEENLFSSDESCGCGCPNTSTIAGVFSTKAKAEEFLANKEKIRIEMGYTFKPHFSIEEEELDGSGL